MIRHCRQLGIHRHCLNHFYDHSCARLPFPFPDDSDVFAEFTFFGDG